MFPQINSREEAAKAVSACTYPPGGIRGVGPRRASLYYTELYDYLKAADTEILKIVQIETMEAVKRIDEILSVPGIDVAFVGPADLSASMGYITSFPKIEKEVVDAIVTVQEACEKHNTISGIWGGSVENVNKYIERGFKFIALGEDADYMIRVKDDLAKIERA